ncbi:MAG: FecR family protein [Bdellovibrionota bacterium]
MKSIHVFTVAALSAFASLNALAESQVGTLTQVEGEVKVFSHPSKTMAEGGTAGARALFEGEYYEVGPAKVGDRVEKGNIVRTAPTAKARVVFDNGDQFNVGPGTAYRIFWKENEAGTNVNLMYGKLRGIIEKGGPRSKLQVKTKTAIMGVRGTDFFIAHGGQDNTTEVSIIRGAVEVKPENAPAATKPVEVKAGMSAEVSAPPAPAETETKAETKTETTEGGKQVAKKVEETKVAPVVELRKTTQEDLIGIQKSSQITQAPKSEDPKKAEEIKKLETKAVETVMKDIKKTDAKLYAQIEKAGNKTTDDINSKAIDKLLLVAPKAPEKRKPYKSELDNLEDGAYEQYFKNVE